MSAASLQRVLFVDDDEVVQRLVQIALERIGGLTVHLVDDSRKAIEAIQDFKPDLIVLDWIMPGMDGVELFHKIRGLPQTAAIPVVFLTVKAHWRTTQDLLELGAIGVITKPFAARELSAQLKAFWEAWRGKATPQG